MGNKGGKEANAAEPQNEPVPEDNAEEAGGGMVDNPQVIGVTADPGFGVDEDDMQDIHKVSSAGSSLAYGIVFDGHGSEGLAVADKCQEAVVEAINSTGDSASMKEYGDAVAEALKSLNAKFVSKEVDVDTSQSGATGTIILMGKEEVCSVHVGAASAILGVKGNQDSSLQAQTLFKNHLVTVPEEKSRIEEAGGIVKQVVLENVGGVGHECVWFGAKHPDKSSKKPGLKVSRVLGNEEANLVGVSGIPEVNVTKKEDKYQFLVVASEGLWEKVTHQEAVDEVLKTNCAQVASKLLADLASRRWEEDWTGENTTVIVYRFDVK